MEISTPIMLDRSLWETSGYLEFYRDSIYSFKVEDDNYAIKPMSCPGGMLVYKLEPRSYKELPMRIGELGIVHRNEKSGALHGLMRVCSFTQDDAHILMREDQVMDEIQGKAVQGMGKSYVINEGDGAFYGPKFDFQLPQRFNIEYIGADGDKDNQELGEMKLDEFVKILFS